MSQILCSTGTFLGKANSNDYRLLGEYAQKLECDGFELMISNAWYPMLDDMIGTVKALELNIPIIHANKKLGEYLCGLKTTFDNDHFTDYFMTEDEERAHFEKGTDLFKENLRAAEQLGVHKMVLHLWNGQCSDRNMENSIRRFGIWKEMAEEAGVDMLVENVVCNKHDPLSNLKLVAEAYDNVGFVYDTKMSEFHQQTMKLFEPEYEDLLWNGHIRHLHINDYGGGYMDWSNMDILPVGKGHVDFDTFFSRMKDFAYDGDITIEATALRKDGTVDFDMLNECLAKVREYTR